MEPKLTFKRALELARGLETAARNVKELKTLPWARERLESRRGVKDDMCYQ